MNAKTFLLLVLVAALAAAGGWWVGHRRPAAGAAKTKSGAREVRFYQSPMHPWIKSDRPGKCTICGMDLVPVYKGEQGFAVAAGVVALGTNSVQVMNVQAEPLGRRTLRRTLRVAGTIDDNDTRHRRISAYIEGRIERLFVNYLGAEVTAGEPLATFYSPALLAAEREYAALARPDSPLARAGLHGDQSLLLEAAGQRLLRLGLTPAQVSALAQKRGTNYLTEIVAPLSGTVVERAVYEGQYVKEGDKLFEIADFAKMWFKFDAYEQDLVWLRPGLVVEITAPSVPGKVFSAPIAFMDPNLDEKTRTAKIRVELDNPLVEHDGRKRRELFHRLYAEGLVRVEVPDVLAIPRSAVLSSAGQALAYVDKGGGNFEQRKLKLGRLADEAWELLAGIAEGERVVTQGNMLIDSQAQLNQSVEAAGAAVAPAPAPAAVPTTTTPAGELTAAEKSAALPELTAAQTKAAQEFFVVADAVTAALAADKVADFNQHAARLHPLLPALVTAFPEASPGAKLVRKIEAAGHLAAAKDLATARRAFLPFSTVTVEFAQALRGRAEFKQVKIYKCPMAPKPGVTSFWVQLQGPLHNPYYGAEMLECGEEVP